jgi:formiminotetrahydrofolate cyclodeaminase
MLAKLSIVEFLEKTASSDPVPGGGSIAALSAALAASLSEMVANLTMGKKDYAPAEEEMKMISKEASRYRNKLSQDIDKDSDAYRQVIAAFKLPKDTEEKKEQREQAIQVGLKQAALVPLGVAKDAFKIIDLAKQVVKKGNKNAVTDGAVAAMMARTAVLAALYNVKINLGSIKDSAFVDDVLKQIQHLEVEITEKEKEVLLEVNL